MTDCCVVLTTLPDKDAANKVIEAVLEDKLAACIQTFPICSHYFWNNDICHDQEIMVLFKTTLEKYASLEDKIRHLHPYDIPEIISLPIEKGLPAYINWIRSVTNHDE